MFHVKQGFACFDLQTVFRTIQYTTAVSRETIQARTQNKIKRKRTDVSRETQKTVPR